MNVVQVDYTQPEQCLEYNQGRYGREPRIQLIGSHNYGTNEYGRRAAALSFQNRSCSYCPGRMVTFGARTTPRTTRDMEDDGAYLGCTYHFEESCLVCDECGWWTHHGISHYSVWPGESSEGRDFKTFESLSWGLVKTFSLESANPPLSELRRWLTQHPHDLAHVNPHAFEKLMAECFKDAYPSAEVLHVGKRTRDHGIDILIILHDREQILVQVKRRSDLTTNEGVEVVRSLNGVMLRQGIPKGIVVSTAKGFTAAAKDEALVSAANVASDLFFHRYQVELMCSSDVIKLLASSQDSEKPNKETILCSLPRMPYQRFVVGEADSGHYCPEDRRWEPLRDIAVRRHVDRLLGRL